MKKHLTITTWRYIIIALLFLLWGLGGLYAQVGVSNMAVNYPAKQISFTVTWTTQPYNNQIWVIVDYIKVAGTATTGSWSRALVTAVTKNSGTGTVSTVTGQKGFWLNTTGASGSANVTATLSLASGTDKFNWCAYTLNKPPTALLQASGSYTLQGSPPFVVNGTTLGAGVTTFGPGTCINTLTDATDNPASTVTAKPTISAVNSPAICYNATAPLTATVSSGTTTAMTYTWNIGGTSSTTTAPNKTTSALTATTTYTVQVRNAAGCTGTVSGIGTITVHPNFTQSNPAATAICYNTTATFNLAAATGGYGTISYQWQQSTNNSTWTNATGTSTNAAYTTPALTSNMYYRRTAKGATCGAATSTNALVTVRPNFTQSNPAATAICYNTTATFNLAAATGGYGTISYQWQQSTNNSTWTNATGTSTSAAYTTPALTSNMYYRRTAKGATCGAATSTNALVTVRPNFTAGSITTASGATSPITNPNITITNSTAASGGDGSITYQWRRSGTSSATLTGSNATYAIGSDPSNYAGTGTYYINRYAHDGTCNTGWVASTGQYTLTVPNVPPYSSTNTYVCGSQTWSVAVSYPHPNCSASTNFGTTNPPTTAMYRSSGLYPGSGYLYNWNCVNEQGNGLCPSPWRVATKDDFIALDKYFGGTGDFREGVSLTWITTNYINKWGGIYGGSTSGTDMFVGGERAQYWARSIKDQETAYCLTFRTDGVVSPQNLREHMAGFQVRCVK